MYASKINCPNQVCGVGVGVTRSHDEPGVGVGVDQAASTPTSDHLSQLDTVKAGQI